MITSFNQFLFRIPQFPIEELYNLETLDEYCRKLLGDKAFLEAIFHASPELYTKLIFLDNLNSKDMERIYGTILKYINRMSSRATPFGTFAGCGYGKIEEQSNFIINEEVPFDKIVRFDVPFLYSVAKSLEKQPFIKNLINFKSNNSVYSTGNSYRYVEFSEFDGDRKYNLASVERNIFLSKILKKAKHGMTFQGLVELIVNEGFTEDESAQYIDELINAQLLISEFEPELLNFTYDEQVFSIFNRLRVQAQGVNNDIVNLLDKTKIRLDDLKSSLLANGILDEEMVKLTNQFGLSFTTKNVFQVDSFIKTNTHATLSKDIEKQVIDAVKILSRISSFAKSPALDRFKQRFYEKYEDEIIPLAIALDPELGIGYSDNDGALLEIVPLVDDILIPKRTVRSVEVNLSWDLAWHKLLFEKITQCLKEDGHLIALSETDLAIFSDQSDRLPPTFNAFFSVYPDQEDTPLIHLYSLGGSSATTMTGRFSYLNDDIYALNEQIQAFENSHYKSSYVAEINHLSNFKSGNIIQRPNFRPLEIAYISASSKTESQISVNELAVCVRNNRILLVDKFGRHILPRLSNAHNFHFDTLPLYRFLSDLQEKGDGDYLDLVPNMAPLYKIFSHLPRIAYKNYIISLETWLLDREDVSSFFQDSHNTIYAIKELAKKYRLPSTFTLGDGERHFFIDIENPLLVQLFVNEYAKQPKVIIKEALMYNSFIKSQKGAFVSEFILPLKNDSQVYKAPALPLPVKKASSRKILPGDGWLYYKIYCGSNTIEKILLNYLPNIIRRLKRKKVIKEYFFIRYSDTGKHLRLRFKLSGQGVDMIYQEINKTLLPLVDSRLIWKISLDTYDRELERYGSELITTAESIFHLDSNHTLNLLSFALERTDEQRWQYSLLTIITYLDAFKLSIVERQQFVEQQRVYFEGEFNANKIQRRAMLNKYRNYKIVLEHLLDYPNNVLIPEEITIFEQFSVELTKTAINKYTSLSVPQKTKYLSSFIHMHIIRFFKGKNRLIEYALYAMLDQYYRSYTKRKVTE